MNTVFWIIEFCSSFVEAFLCTIFCGTFIENIDFKKNLNKRIIAALVATSAMLIVNHINIYSFVTVILGFSFMALISFAVYSKNPLKASVLGITFLLLIAVIDNVVVSIISYALKIPTVEIYQEMSLYRVLAIISSKTMLLFVVIAMNKLFSKRRTMQRNYMIALFTITTIMFTITVLITFIDIKNNAVNSIVSILFFSVMLILLLVIFFGTFKLTEYYENQEELKLITLKNQMLENSMSETEQTFMLWKKSMHDYKHNIVNLITLADNNNLNGIKAYLQSENKLLAKKLFYYKTGNDTVDSIIYIKQKKAEAKNIPFIINAEIPEKCPVLSAHFASVLGNLLDNAIEAAVKCETPAISVTISEDKAYLIVMVKNTIVDSVLKNNPCLKTTKINKKHHGLGMLTIQDIVNKYNGIFDFEEEENSFIVDVRLKKSKIN